MAPEESSYRTSGQVVFNMPMPDGTTQAFSIFKSVVMHPDLAANFPEIKTFAGYGIDHPEDHIRLDITPLGFHAMILSPRGQVFIDPYSTNTTTDYICYYKKMLPEQRLSHVKLKIFLKTFSDQFLQIIRTAFIRYTTTHLSFGTCRNRRIHCYERWYRFRRIGRYGYFYEPC
ncbi:MAG: hypothetical protein IPL74_13795 [Bacteroidetes bacterium]|nr:hypothetical protein [Bacteroidota bacterium]